MSGLSSGTGFDSRTALRLSEIADLIQTHLPNDVIVHSILVSGGFARGESGHYKIEERWIPFGDYDLDVVVSRILLDSETDLVYDAIESATGFRSVNEDSTPTLVEEPKVFNVLDIRFKTLDEFGQRAPDLALYDFLQSYRVVHGEDLGKKLKPISIHEVSPFSPWRILGNRITLLFKHVNIDFLANPPTLHEALAFRLAACRVWLDLAGILSFLHGGYQTSPAARLAFLTSNAGAWRTWLPEPDSFLNQVQNAVQFKREPRLDRLSGEELFREWFTLVTDLGRILPHLTNLLLLSRRIPIATLSETLLSPDSRPGMVVNDPFGEDWRGMVARQLREYPGLYFREFIRVHLNRAGKRLPMEKTLCGFASRYYGLSEHLMWRGKKWTLKNLRRSTLAPTAFQSAIQPLVLFSLRPDLQVDLDALELFESLMEPYMMLPFAFLEPAKRWEANKRCFVHELLDYRRRS